MRCVTGRQSRNPSICTSQPRIPFAWPHQSSVQQRERPDGVAFCSIVEIAVSSDFSILAMRRRVMKPSWRRHMD
jgi:hypothetical protein